MFNLIEVGTEAQSEPGRVTTTAPKDESGGKILAVAIFGPVLASIAYIGVHHHRTTKGK